MKAILGRIPAKARRVFYALPLFVQWIVGLTWEEDAEQLRPARRAMVLGLCFLVGISTIYVLRQTMAYLFSGSLDYYVGWVVFVLHVTIAGAYWLGSLFVIVMEVTGGGRGAWLDALADAFERKLSV